VIPNSKQQMSVTFLRLLLIFNLAFVDNLFSFFM
jgi:hypothetical protein